MAFLQTLKIKEANPPSEFDVKCASKLKEALITKNLLRRTTSLKSWSHEFRILRKTVKEKDIKSILNWYCVHAGEKFICVALSAHAFRMKFDRIKFQSENQRVEPKVHLEYDKRTKSVYRELEHLHWPKGSKSQLLDVIQDSVTAYGTWLSCLFQPELMIKVQQYDAKVSHSRNRINGHQIENLLKELRLLTPSHVSFVSNWFLNVHKSVQNWEAWSGNLRAMGVQIDGKKFQAQGHEWTSDYCGDPERWDKLMELMK